MKNISAKELNYANDILSWELLGAKKCFQYACQEANSAHQQIFIDAARTHQQNYTNIINYIEQINSMQGGQAH